MSGHQSSTHWVAVIAHRGIICKVRVCPNHDSAASVIAAYLRKHHRYDGDDTLPAVAEWVQEHEPDFDVQIVEQDGPMSITDEAVPIDDAIKQGQFIVISVETAQSPPDHYSAWLYEGALDFNAAFPLRFGVGPTVLDALNALASELRADTA